MKSRKVLAMASYLRFGTIPEWLSKRRSSAKIPLTSEDAIDKTVDASALEIITTPEGQDVWYVASRARTDKHEEGLLRDVAFNKHSMNDGEHVSPLDNATVQVGGDGIIVELVQGIDEESFKRTIGMATRATIGVDLAHTTVDDLLAGDDWEEMMKGGLQTALESAVLVFAVSGVSRTCTHQIVRSRRAAFHQQSQRASYYGDRPEARMPESVWRNERARYAWLIAKSASDEAYRIACEEDISYQDARYVLLEGTDNFIMTEYNVREFLAVFAYRGCSMFSWEIVTVMRKMREALLAAHPWLEPFVKITCEKTGVCEFQGWENVEGQCDFPMALESNRRFQPKLHKIEYKKS